MNENIDYTIGDDVVCIRNHPDGILKEGEIFTVLGIKHDSCTKCGGIVVDVGIKPIKQFSIGKMVQCHLGHRIFEPFDGKAWFCSTRFKKLDTLVNISELTEVLEKPMFS